MHTLKKTIFTTLALFIAFNIAAQEKQPVQFSFVGIRDSVGQAYVSIKAKIDDSVFLFSAIKKLPDDAFVSAVDFDIASCKSPFRNFKEALSKSTAETKASSGNFLMAENKETLSAILAFMDT